MTDQKVETALPGRPKLCKPTTGESKKGVGALQFGFSEASKIKQDTNTMQPEDNTSQFLNKISEMFGALLSA